MIKTDKTIEKLLLATIKIMTENKCKFAVLPEGNFFAKMMNCKFVALSKVTGLAYVTTEGKFKQITTQNPFVDLRLYTSLFDGIYQCVCECDGTRESIRLKYEDFLADKGKKPNVAYVYMETPCELIKGQPKLILIGEDAAEKCENEGNYEDFDDDIDELIDQVSNVNMGWQQLN
jgi:hypothetical protein